MNKTMILSAVYQAVDKVTGPVRKMTASVRNFENLTRRGRGMQEWGTKAAIGAAMVSEASTKIEGALNKIKEPYLSLEREVAGLDQVMKSSGQNHVASMNAAKKAAVDWEKQHGDSAASFIGTVRQMSAANLKDVDAIRASRYALTLAKGTLSDTSTAVEILTYSYQTLGDKNKSVTSEMKKHADMTAKVQQIYQMRGLAEYTDAMKDALPAAAIFRQKYEESAVAVGTLQRAGWAGGKAGGSYAAILGTMEKASAELNFTISKTADGSMDFVKTIDNISNRYGDLTKVTPEVRDQLKAAFGDDGLRTLMVFQKQSGQMKQSMDDLRNSTGAAADARNKLENTSGGKMEKAAARLNSIWASVGERIFNNAQIMDEILPKFIDTVEWAINLGLAFAETNPTLTTGLLVLGAIGTGLLLIVAPLMSVIGGIITFGGVALSAFGTAAGALGTFYSFLASGAALQKAMAMMRLLHIKYIALRGCVLTNIGAMQTFALRTLAAGKAGAIAAAQGIRSMIVGLMAMGKSAIFTAATAMPGLIAATWAWTAALLANPMTWIVLGIMALIAVIILCVVYWDEIAAACGRAWEWIKVTAGEGVAWLKTLPQQLLDFVGGLGSMFYDAGAKLWKTFADGIGSVVSAPVEWVKKGIKLIDDYLPHSDARKGPLSRLTWSGSRLMSTFAAGIPKGVGTLQKIMDKVMGTVKINPDDPDNPFNPFGSEDPPPNPFGVGGGKGPSGGAGGVLGALATKASGVVFNGPVHIKLPNVKNPKDFMETLQEMAAETGAI